jgi:hypothetical protein
VPAPTTAPTIETPLSTTAAAPQAEIIFAAVPTVPATTEVPATTNDPARPASTLSISSLDLPSTTNSEVPKRSAQTDATALVAKLDPTSTATNKIVTTSGSGFQPGAEITLTLQSSTKPLGKIFADANGSFTFTANLDADIAGDQTIVADGVGSDNRSITKRASFNVKGIALQKPVSAPPGLADLAFTGANSILMALVALALLLAGSFLLRKSSKRK